MRQVVACEEADLDDFIIGATDLCGYLCRERHSEEVDAVAVRVDVHLGVRVAVDAEHTCDDDEPARPLEALSTRSIAPGLTGLNTAPGQAPGTVVSATNE